MITVKDAHDNLYFCGGNNERLFEKGQERITGWKGHSELDVLCERVASGLKPVGSMVMQPRWSEAERQRVISKAKKHNLVVSLIKNEWLVDQLFMTASPKTTIEELLVGRGKQGRGLVLQKKLKKKTIGSYISSGFDCSATHNKVSVLECALLYGYPLDLAKSMCNK